MKENKHDKLLLLSLIVIEDVLRNHREKCDNWSYSPKLKATLTNCRKKITECINLIDYEVIKEDNIFLKKELDKYYNKKRCKKNNKNISEFIIKLPRDFMDDIVVILNIMDFVIYELKQSTDRRLGNKFKEVLTWYNKFDQFLEKTVFI